MTVFELLGTETSFDWATRGREIRIGLFSSADKAEAKIKEIKKDKNWKMSWSFFRVIEVKVE